MKFLNLIIRVFSKPKGRVISTEDVMQEYGPPS
jgi:hypothetical protein